MLYFDSAATSLLSQGARDKINYALENFHGNPSSIHSLGVAGQNLIEEARESLAKLLKVESKHLIFTSGATESINTVLKGFWEVFPKAPKILLTSKVEHSATLETCKYLERKGIEVIYLSPDNSGKLRHEDLVEGLSAKPGLVSLMHVNNETGSITDPVFISQLIKEIFPRAKLHMDIAQSLGKIDIDLKDAKVDYLSMSAHKIHGPMGAGALYSANPLAVFPLLSGGGQEFEHRSGTQNLLGITGFGGACDDAITSLGGNVALDIGKLKSFLLTSLSEWTLNKAEYEKYENSKNPSYRINSNDEGSPYILNISFPGIRPQVLIRLMETRGAYISSVSACSSKTGTGSRVLNAMGLDPLYSESSVRISFSRYNTLDEVKQLSDILIESVESLIR